MSQQITITAALAGADQNATPAVVAALAALQKTGGTLCFEQGEYHFKTEGAYPKFLGISNNTSGDKRIAFPVLDAENITIDGCGATFIFHRGVFPFALQNSQNVTVKNIIFDVDKTPMAVMRVTEKTETGFKLEIDKEKYPYRVENGELVLLFEGGERRGCIDLHGIDQFLIRYYTTGAHNPPPGNLPVPCVHAEAREVEGGVYLTYLPTSEENCVFEEGSRINTSLFGGREAVGVLMDHCKNVKVENFTVRRCVGMGILGEGSEDIEINGFKTDVDYYGEGWTTSVDALHFVNCKGKLNIHHCKASHPRDDILNVHGNYTEIESAQTGRVFANIKHYEQAFFNPYHKGDRLSLIDPFTYEIVGHFVVEEARFCQNDGKRVEINGFFEDGEENAVPGVLLENPDRMPDLSLHDNSFWHFPHMRISGAGKIVIENNRLENCRRALAAQDLMKFWYESGRIRDMTIQNNDFVNCNGLADRDEFIFIGMSGIPIDDTPEIHGRITITGNRFTELRRHAVVASGAAEVIIYDNEMPDDMDGLVVFDGIPQ